MKAVYPVHTIEQLSHFNDGSGMYVTLLSEHLERHDFISQPHKHDFYFVFLCTAGYGKQEIDFKMYEVRPGSVFFMSPGQIHRLIDCKDGEGYILLHTRDFYEVAFNNRNLRDYPFYFCAHNHPTLQLDTTQLSVPESYFKELMVEQDGNEPGRYQKCCSLIDLLYIYFSREYKKSYSSSHLMPGTSHKVKQLVDLIDEHFMKLKSPSDYARLMKTSTRQLNRLCQETFGKTTSDLILDRVILEAKRNLLHCDNNIAEVAADLGYFDTAYFSRLFRKRTMLTPSEFIRKYSSSLELV